MNDYSYMTADPFLYSKLKEFVKTLRNSRPTLAESLLWECLRGKSLGVKFRRQHVIGPFIADFCCVEKQLVLELDGGYHQLPDQQIRDEERQEWLESKGFKILRFPNEEIEYNIEYVLETIKKYI